MLAPLRVGPLSSRRFSDFLARFRKGSVDPDHKRLAAIVELNRNLASVSDRKSLFTLLLDAAVELFAAERGFLILTQTEGTGWRVEQARNVDKESIKTPEKKLSTTVVRRCLDERAGVFSEDALEGEFGAAQSVADMRLRSVLSAPLLVGERCLGCIYLDHRFQSRAFHAEDLPWIAAFADQAAIALNLHTLLAENVEFAERLRQRNETLEREVLHQEQELTDLRTELTRDRLQHPYPEIVGRSPALLRSLHLLDKIVPGEYPVMLVGESGTGKELFARAIWSAGARSRGPFVPVNIAAISETLLESELFGHEKGAFTGADKRRPGLLREADGGVLFLDEVTEMPVEMQVKLLRFLEDHVIRSVGGVHSERVDVRVVAATNRAPLEQVERGLFRRDLYYRLAVVTLELPPLRERRVDLPELVKCFLAEAAGARNGATPREASPALLQVMARRSWPGNLRQLKNEVLRLDALATQPLIGPDLLGAEEVTVAARDLNLDGLERWAIEEALQRTGGNKAEAARMLGISRRALYNKLGT